MSNGPRRSARRRPASVEPGSTRRKQNRTGARVRIRPLPRSQKMQLSSGRGSRIRTCGPLLPKQVLYQAELCPDTRRIKELFGHLCGCFTCFLRPEHLSKKDFTCPMELAVCSERIVPLVIGFRIVVKDRADCCPSR